MEKTEALIREFWRWFVEHQSEFDTLSKPDEPFWDIALEYLKKVDERLWIELSARGDIVREFVITAKGHEEAFSIVEELVSLAPNVEEWAFLALKPSMGFTFTTQYEGILFLPGEMWFLPINLASRPLDFGLRIGIKGLDALDETLALNALSVVLDTGLGERSAAFDIQYVEVAELPPNPESLGYIRLPELADYIAWRKRKLGPEPDSVSGTAHDTLT